MKNKSMNKKGIAPLFIILFVILLLLFFYVLLYIPLPFFEKGRVIVNYFLIVIFWVVIQVGLLYGYYQLGNFASKSFYTLKSKVFGLSKKIEHYLIIHT